MKQPHWYVLITKPRAEKKVVQRLLDINLEVYCPVKIEMRQWSDRKKRVEVPILPSMVFVRLTDSQRSLVFDVSGVVRYLFWLGEPAIVRELEIETLKEALDSLSSDSKFLEDVFTTDFLEKYSELKYKEYTAFAQTPTAWEVSMYADA